MRTVCKSATELTKKIKGLEAAFEQHLKPNLPFVVRLDGCNFKAFTSRLKKPFDHSITKALQDTTIDLMSRFEATTGFCQSDEITLISPPATFDDPKNMLYHGRVQKIASVIASFAAARFNHHFRSHIPDPADTACFDARVFSVSSWLEATEVIIWRQQHDCRRNALASIVQAHFSHKFIAGKPLKDMVELLLKEKGVDAYTAYPPENVYGTFVKRVKEHYTALNPITGDIVPVERARLVAKAFDLNTTDVNMLEAFIRDPIFPSKNNDKTLQCLM